MTVVVCVKVSEGLVLAADSTVAIPGRLTIGGTTADGIVKTYNHGRKLCHIKDYPVGVLTWGLALIGSRNIESLVREYEHGLLSVQDSEEQGEALEFSVKDIASGLLSHLRAKYQDASAHAGDRGRRTLGVMVSGYSSSAFFPEQYLFELPRDEAVQPIRPDKDGKPDFGANWYGLTDAITRFHWGRDDNAMALLASKFSLAPDDIATALRPLQYGIIFDGMPLQDAIDYAVFIVNLEIGRYRFAIGAPLCGGEIDVAVITPEGFEWVDRREWCVGHASMWS